MLRSLVVVLAFFCGAIPVDGQELFPVFASVDTEPYVPVAIVERGAGVFHGNAVFVSRELRLFVTNAHVIGSSPEAVFLWLGDGWVPAVFRNELIDRRNDLAVVQAHRIPSRYQACPLRFAKAPPDIGEILLVVGTQLEWLSDRSPSSGYLRRRFSGPFLVAIPRARRCVSTPSCANVVIRFGRAFLGGEIPAAQQLDLGSDYIAAISVARRKGVVLRRGLSGSPALNGVGDVAGIVSGATAEDGTIAVFAPGFIAAGLVERAARELQGGK